MTPIEITLRGNASQAIQAFSSLNKHVKVGRDALNSFERAGSLVGVNVAPQITAGIHAMSDAFKTLSGSAKLGIGSIGALAVGASAVFIGWKAAIDEVRKSLDELDKQRDAKVQSDAAERYAKSVRSTLNDKINRELALGNIGEGEAKTLKLNVALMTGETIDAVDKKYKEFLETVFGSARKKKIEDSENIKAFESLLSDKKVELLSGFEKEREQARRDVDKFLIEASKAAEKIDSKRRFEDESPTASSQAVEMANKLLVSKLAEIDTKQAEEKAKIEKQAQDEYRKFIQDQQRSQMFEDEAMLREYEHLQRVKEIETQRAQQKISGSPFLTDSEKYDQLKASGVDMSGSVNPDSLPENMLAAWVQMQNQIGTIQQQIADSWVNIMGAAINSTTNSIIGLIDGTMNWNDALRNVGRTILTEVVASIVRMGVQYVVTHVLMRGAMALTSALGIALGWKQVVNTNAQEAAKAPSLAANAASAAIGSYGAAAVVGAVLAVAALGAIMAVALGAFAEGGYTGAGGKYEPAGIVHRGEVVWSQADVARAGGVGNAELMRKSGGASGASSNSGKQVLIYMVDTESAVRRIMESHVGDDIIVRKVNQNRMEAGITT